MRRIILLALALAGLVLVGCTDQDEKGTGDTAVDRNLQDDQPPLILNFPNDFMNVALKCVGGDLIVTHRRNPAPPLLGVGATACRPGEAEKLGIPRVKGVVPSG